MGFFDKILKGLGFESEEKKEHKPTVKKKREIPERNEKETA